jgi:hypothetical protein
VREECFNEISYAITRNHCSKSYDLPFFSNYNIEPLISPNFNNLVWCRKMWWSSILFKNTSLYLTFTFMLQLWFLSENIYIFFRKKITIRS